MHSEQIEDRFIDKVADNLVELNYEAEEIEVLLNRYDEYLREKSYTFGHSPGAVQDATSYIEDLENKIGY